MHPVKLQKQWKSSKLPSSFSPISAIRSAIAPHRPGIRSGSDALGLGAHESITESKTSTALSSELEPGHLRSYLSGLYDSHEKSSLCRRLSAIRSFLKYLRAHGSDRAGHRRSGADAQNEKDASGVSQDRGNVRTDRGAGCCPRDLGRRDRAIFEIIYGCGLRVSEAVGLNFGDVDFQNGWVTVMGKGSKQRTVPFGPPAREALENYLSDRARTCLGEDRRFS